MLSFISSSNLGSGRPVHDVMLSIQAVFGLPCVVFEGGTENICGGLGMVPQITSFSKQLLE